MAKNQAGILSPAIGKVSGVVGFRWKDKAALRGYVIPANPNTVAQQAQRAVFAAAAQFSSALLGQILQPYMDPFIKGMSGYNWCVKTNIPYFTAPIAYSSMSITKGNLFPLQTVTAAWAVPGHEVVFTWDPATGNNGFNSDDVILVVYDAVSKVVYFSLAALTRGLLAGTVTLPVGHPGTDLHSFACVSQTAGGIMSRVANSVYTLVV